MYPANSNIVFLPTTLISVPKFNWLVLIFLGISSSLCPAHTDTKVRLQLRFDHQFQFAGYYAAKKMGYYAQHGLDVEIINGIDNEGRQVDVVGSVLNNNADFGIGAADVLSEILHGKDIYIVTSILQNSAVGIMIDAEKKINSPAMLQGLRLLPSQNMTVDAEINAMFSAEGISAKNLNIIHYDTIRPVKDQIDDLLSHKVDGNFGYTLSIPWYARAKGMNLSIIRPSSYGIDFYGDAIFTSGRMLKEDKESVDSFRAASIKGWEYALNNRAEIIAYIVQEFPRRLPLADPVGYNEYLADEISKLMLYPNIEVGHTNKLRWQMMATTLHLEGHVADRINITDRIYDKKTFETEELNKRLKLTGLLGGGFVLLLAGFLYRKHQARVSHYQQRYSTLVNANVIGVMVTSFTDSSIIHEANDKFLDIIGYNRSDLEAGNIDWRALTPPEYADVDKDKVNQLLKTGQAAIWEKEYIRKDGSRVPILLVVVSVLSKQKEILALATIIDISKQKVLENEQQALLFREQQARQELERLSTIKDEFLVTLSHELRTPLNAVLGWAQILNSKDYSLDDEKKRHALEVIERNALAEVKLIDELLDISRIISGKIELSIDDVAPGDLIDEVLQSYHQLLATKNIQVNRQYDKQAIKVSIDRDRFRQVLWNVIGNAIKFNKIDGEINISFGVIDNEFFLDISDKGIGIDAKSIPILFEKFRQADNSVARIYGGLGIGLAVSSDIVKLHGGRIEITSEGADKGCDVKIYLKKFKIQSSSEGLDTIDVSKKEARHPQKNTLSGIRILLVDDDQDNLFYMREVLQAHGADIYLAENSQQAFEYINGSKIDAMLCDLGMPGKSGFDIVSDLRKMNGAVASLPSAAVTAFADKKSRERALDAGFNDLVSKPVMPSTLLQLVDKLIN